MTVNQLKLSALGGNGELTGYSNWKDGATWDTQVDLNKMNIRPYVPSMPAVLSGKLHSKGFAGAKGWQVEIPTVDLAGSLSSYPVSLKGAATLSNKTLLNIPDLQLNYGDNKINAKGILGEQSNLTLNLQAPNLRGLWADLQGGIIGNAKISGKLMAPEINLDLTASHLQLQGLNLAKASVKGAISSEPLMKGQLNVKADQLYYGEILKLRAIDLALYGDEKDHQLNLKSQGGKFTNQRLF